MRFQVTTTAPAKQRTDCLILPVFADSAPSASLRAADKATGGCLTDLITAGDIRGKIGDTLLVRPQVDTPFQRVLLVGCGPRDDFGRRELRRALAAGFAAWRKTKFKSAVCYVTAERAKGTDATRRAATHAQKARSAVPNDM